MKRYKPYFNEDIIIPLKSGDIFFHGKFKNKQAIYDSHYFNDKGDLVVVTDTGKEIPACKIRLLTEAENKIYFIRATDKREATKNNPLEFGEFWRFFKSLKDLDNLIKSNELYVAKNTKDDRYMIIGEGDINELELDYSDLTDEFKSKEMLFKSKDLFSKDYSPSTKILYQGILKLKPKLEENLRLSDLKKHAGLSDFTKNWKNKRQQIIGSGAKSAKIKSIKINRKKDYITFVFTSIPTYSKTATAVAFPLVDKEKRVRAYTQEIRILDFFKWADTKPGYKEKDMTIKEIKEILNIADIQVSCNCKSFQFQGFNHILTTFDAAIYPEDRPPTRWRQYHNDDSFVCKHLSILITSGLNIYINNMTSMVNKYLKGSK